MSFNYSHINTEQITQLQQNCTITLLQTCYIQSDLVSVRRVMKLVRMSNSLFPCIMCSWKIIIFLCSGKIIKHTMPGAVDIRQITQGLKGVYELWRTAAYTKLSINICHRRYRHTMVFFVQCKDGGFWEKKKYLGPGTPWKTILEEVAMKNKIWINGQEHCSNPSGRVEENSVHQRMKQRWTWCLSLDSPEIGA